MHKSKFLALLLAVAMVVSMVVVPVYAEGGITYSLTSDKTTVAPGETVTVTLSMAGNTGFDKATVRVNYSEALAIESRDTDLYKDVLKYNGGDIMRTISPAANNPQILSFITSPEDENEEQVTGNGNLVSFTFKAPEADGTYEVSLEITKIDSNKDLAGNAIDVTLGDPVTITVETPVPYACPEHKDVTTWTEVNEDDWTNGTVIAAAETGDGPYHYKLNADISLDAIYKSVANAMVIPEGKKVCIDLNGHTITAQRESSSGGYGTRVFHVLTGGNLTILDSAEGGTITGGYARGSLGTNSNKGAGVEVDSCGGNIYVQSGATFTLVSGTITGGTATSGTINAYNRGGNIYGEADSTINIKGGTVSDGEIDRSAGARSYGYSQQSGGGNIASEGTLNITGGTITGGNVHGTYKTEYSGETISKAYQIAVYGGNIMVLSTGTLAISNATITDGSLDVKTDNKNTATAKNASGGLGGNIYSEVDVTIKNSTISGGQITVAPYEQTTVTAGYEILGGNLAVRGGDLTVTGTSEINGGQINFSSTICDTANAVVKGGNVCVSGGNVVLKDTAKISGGTLKDTGATSEDTASEDAGFNYTKYMGTWVAGPALCVIGATEAAPGRVELHDDAELLGGTGGYRYGNALCIDGYYDAYVWGGRLRGFGATGDYGKAYMYDGNIFVTGSDYRARTIFPDAVGDGNHCNNVVDGWWNADAYHTNLPADGYCSVCEYTYTSPVVGHHTYEVIASTEEGGRSTVGACTACGYAPSCGNPAHAGATWYVFSERPTRDVSGHAVMLADEEYKSSQLQVASTDEFCLDMNGYTFDQNWVYKSAKVLNNAGNTIIYNGTIMATGGGSNDAGSIIAHSVGSLTLRDVTVIGSTKEDAPTGSVNVHSGTAYFVNCIFKDGTTTTSGGNLNFAGGNSTLKNCIISGGNSLDGGNISLNNAAAVVTMENCKVIDGEATRYGGNIALTMGATLSLIDCELIGGTVEGTGDQRGGNLYSATNGAKITIDGGVIADGVAGAEGTTTGRGGNIFIQRVWDNSKNNHLTVTGGTVIKNGTATKDGGNLCLIYASLDLDDCEIFDGSAPDGGNIATTSSGEGCTIRFGGAVNIHDGSVNLAQSSYKEEYPATYTFESGAQVGEIAVASSNMVVNAAANVTYTGDVLPGAVSHKDGETDTYKTYATVADAVAAVVGEGDTVVLGDDATADALSVNNYVLDLNGNKLTATSVTAADSNSKVIDTVGGGILASETVALYVDNGYLPVKTEGGYYLEEVAMKQKVDVVNETTKKVKFVVSDAADATYLDTCLVNGDEVKFYVTVNYGEDDHVSQYFPASVVQQYVGENGANWGNKMFVCTIKGLDKLEGTVTFSASIVANGVEIAATDVSAN